MKTELTQYLYNSSTSTRKPAPQQLEQSEKLQLDVAPYLDQTADLSSIHYPRLEKGHWFAYTQTHFMTALKLTPCARLLWDWILLKAPAGCLIDVDLKDFQAIVAEQRRGKPYSMRQIRNAVSELEKLQLVEIKSERTKMLARHSGSVTNWKQKSEQQEINFQNSQQARKLISTPRKLISAPTPETVTTQASHSSTDLYRSIRSTTTDHIAAASEILKEETPGEQLTAGVNQSEEVGGDPDHQSEEVLEEEQSQVELPQEGKTSAVQLEALKSLGIIISHRLKDQLASTPTKQVDAALACFKQDKAEWSGEMKNPAGYFISVLRQVAEGRQPVIHQIQQVDPIEEDLKMWQRRWKNALPGARDAMKRDIQANFPNGEIVVRNWEEGPIAGYNCTS